jgi:hypothetical protein
VRVVEVLLGLKKEDRQMMYHQRVMESDFRGDN